MPVDLSAIGTLTTIAVSVVNAAKGLQNLFAARRGTEKEENTLNTLQTAFNEYNGRMRVLAEQLDQSERLTRMVPTWLELANRMPVWKQASELDDYEAKMILDDLRRFIHDSIRDHFSGTFFHTDFAKLPNIPDKLNVFRARLKTIDGILSPITNTAGLRTFWPQIATQLNDAVNAARDIQQDADNIQGDLIKELRDAANLSFTS